jgi:hypothetical protein
LKPATGNDSLHDTSNEKRRSISFTNEAALTVNVAQKETARSRLSGMREITTAYIHLVSHLKMLQTSNI